MRDSQKTAENENPVVERQRTHRWRRAFQAAVGLLAVLAVIFWWRSLNRLAVVGRSPIPLDVISAEYKPLIRIPNLRGGHFEFPARPEPHRSWKSVPGSSGIVFAKNKKKIFANPQWIIDGRSYAVIDEERSPESHEAVCPMLYGTSASIAELRPKASETETIRIRLPGGGAVPPEIHTSTVVVGDLRIIFQPRPLVSPAFGIDYDVRIAGGKKGAAYFLNLSSSIDGDLSSNSALLKIEPEKAAHFRINTWSQRTHVQGALMEVAPEPLEIKVQRKETSIEGSVDFTYPDGIKLTSVSYSLKKGSKELLGSYLPNLRGFIAVDIAGRSVSLDYASSNVAGEGPHADSFAQFALNLKPGTVNAVAYNRLTEIWFAGELELPTRRTSRL